MWLSKLLLVSCVSANYAVLCHYSLCCAGRRSCAGCVLLSACCVSASSVGRLRYLPFPAQCGVVDVCHACAGGYLLQLPFRQRGGLSVTRGDESHFTVRV